MNQKLENLLQLALQTPEEIREETEDLNVGFDALSRTWELIVKYHGSLDALGSLGVGIEYLIAGYAILTVRNCWWNGWWSWNRLNLWRSRKGTFTSRFRLRKAPAWNRCSSGIRILPEGGSGGGS